MKTDRLVTNMPKIRMNANKLVKRLTAEREEIQLQSMRLQQVDVSDYVRRCHSVLDQPMRSSNLYQPADSHFRHRKQSVQIERLSCIAADTEDLATPQKKVSLIHNTPTNQALFKSLFLQSVSEHPTFARRSSQVSNTSRLESI